MLRPHHHHHHHRFPQNCPKCKVLRSFFQFRIRKQKKEREKERNVLQKGRERPKPTPARLLLPASCVRSIFFFPVLLLRSSFCRWITKYLSLGPRRKTTSPKGRFRNTQNMSLFFCYPKFYILCLGFLFLLGFLLVASRRLSL